MSFWKKYASVDPTAELKAGQRYDFNFYIIPKRSGLSNKDIAAEVRRISFEFDYIQGYALASFPTEEKAGVATYFVLPEKQVVAKKIADQISNYAEEHRLIRVQLDEIMAWSFRWWRLIGILAVAGISIGGISWAASKKKKGG